MMFVKYMGYRSEMIPRFKIWAVIGLGRWFILKVFAMQA